MADDELEIADAASADTKAALAWLKRLEAKLLARSRSTSKFSRYYEGDHPLLFASEKFRESFGGLFNEFADNWCDLVVDAVAERLNVTGFRFGTDELNKEAWRIWQANHLDADATMGHVEALIAGTAYALVWAGDDENTPQITVESPGEMIVASASGNRRNRLAALKRWFDEESERLYATVYLPDAIWKFQSGKKDEFEARNDFSTSSRWSPRLVPGESWPLANPLGRVTVVPLENRPRLCRAGVSELKRVVPMQDAVNKLVADMLVASEFGAFKQRWVTGMDIPEDPDTGKPIEPFKIAVNRLLMAEPTVDEDTGKFVLPQFGEFTETRLENFVTGIEMLVQHIASQTRTPPHYFYLRGEFPSGESIKSAETGLVAKVKDRMVPFGEGWEEAEAIGLEIAGHANVREIVDAETVWGDPESRSEAEHTDSTLKLKGLGLPDEFLWEYVGLTPKQIERARSLRELQALTVPERIELVLPSAGARNVPGPEPAPAA